MIIRKIANLIEGESYHHTQIYVTNSDGQVFRTPNATEDKLHLHCIIHEQLEGISEKVGKKLLGTPFIIVYVFNRKAEILIGKNDSYGIFIIFI
ncbi:hypothetical protein [Peribacillus muralis]|uniref:hypothetical protein n=1 Tax=Peribacillus muralis TaxID=264697 RepID=UPI00070AF9D5|nr:hypothetical protein [Peribacillus muralis]